MHVLNVGYCCTRYLLWDTLIAITLVFYVKSNPSLSISTLHLLLRRKAIQYYKLYCNPDESALIIPEF